MSNAFNYRVQGGVHRSLLSIYIRISSPRGASFPTISVLRAVSAFDPFLPAGGGYAGDGNAGDGRRADISHATSDVVRTCPGRVANADGGR
jgi:hypothetical protein